MPISGLMSDTERASHLSDLFTPLGTWMQRQSGRWQLVRDEIIFPPPAQSFLSKAM
jgi:hypothetical protein